MILNTPISFAPNRFCSAIKIAVVYLALLMAYNGAGYAQNMPSLAEFDLQLKEGEMLPLGNTIRFKLKSSHPEGLANILANYEGINIMPFDKNHLLIEMQESIRYKGQASRTYLEDSFVIDISEPSVRDFVTGFVSPKEEIEPNQLAQFVSEYITRPTYENGFNIASVVASGRSGDCTEYAVLLAALSRSLGIPARVILGTIIVEEDNYVSAIGHAWVEVYFNEKWQTLDAAMYQSTANKHFYLPSGHLENEGPGYSWGMSKSTVLLPINISWLTTVE